MFNVELREDTGREFVHFEDCNGRPCELSQSSLYVDGVVPGAAAIRLGIRHTRMHLDRDLVEELVLRLQQWLRTGSFLDVPKSEPDDLQEQLDATKRELGMGQYMIEEELEGIADTGKGDLEKDVLGKLHTAEPDLGAILSGEKRTVTIHNLEWHGDAIIAPMPEEPSELPSVSDVLEDMERVTYAVLQRGLATIHDSLCATQAIISAYDVDSPDSDPSHMRWDINAENEGGVLKLYLEGETVDGSQRVVRELSVHTDGHVDAPTGTLIYNLTPGKHEIHRV